MTRRRLLVLFLSLLPVLALSAPAYALELDAAKAQGLVGEQPDGLLGIVKAAPEVTALVADVNARRLAKFREIASANGQPLATVQAVAGQDFINRTARGNYIKDASGDWVKK